MPRNRGNWFGPARCTAAYNYPFRVAFCPLPRRRKQSQVSQAQPPPSGDCHMEEPAAPGTHSRPVGWGSRGYAGQSLGFSPSLLHPLGPPGLPPRCHCPTCSSLRTSKGRAGAVTSTLDPPRQSLCPVPLWGHNHWPLVLQRVKAQPWSSSPCLWWEEGAQGPAPPLPSPVRSLYWLTTAQQASA